MTTQKAAWASPELHKAPLSPCFRRNYTTPWDTTEFWLFASEFAFCTGDGHAFFRS
jgi:hypothetical protein